MSNGGGTGHFDLIYTEAGNAGFLDLWIVPSEGDQCRVIITLIKD